MHTPSTPMTHEMVEVAKSLAQRVNDAQRLFDFYIEQCRQSLQLPDGWVFDSVKAVFVPGPDA